MKKIDKSTLDEIVMLIENNIPYREILRKNPVLKSTSMVSRIKKIHIDGKTTSQKKLSDKTKRKIQLAAVERRALEESDLIVNGYIDILKAFTYSIQNLDEIQLLHKKGTDDLYVILQEIVKRLDRYFDKTEIDETEQLDIRTKVNVATQKISNLHKNSLLRIKAIDAIRNQLDSILKFKIEIQGIEQINYLISSFLRGTEVLSDEEYFKYKSAVINFNEFARVFFDRWDAGVYKSDLSATTE
ncbi:MAG: hypothetical protein IPM56_03000 [Ignavibacteriales bacterium]|nr:MAG: hypothetical protein IPM56_03000 [Ignavibacteriales bacterium]